MPNKETFGLLVEGRNTTVPLTESKVEVSIQGFIASVESTLVYRNDTSEVLQTSYVFPMDDMSAVYSFEANVNNKHIVAECQEKEQARKTYKDAIHHGHTAMLLSEDDMVGDIFECKLGNLPAGEKAVLTMSYIVELSIETEGKMRFMLPAVLIPRYSPDIGCYKDPGHEPTQDQIDIEKPQLLTFSANVQGHHKILSVTSTNDIINVDIGIDKQTATIKLVETFKFEHDLTFDVVYQGLSGPEILLELGNKEKDGLLKEDLLMLNFVPDFKPDGDVGKREFIFVIDRSGSMTGKRIEKAKETLLLLLKSLPVGCLFNVVSFGSSHCNLFKKSNKYTETSLKEALELQESMNADMGGTEILRPLQNIYSKKCQSGYPRQIFLLTDGGVGNTDDVVKLVSKHKGNTRVFTFGIGQGASTSLIKNVARGSNGKAYFITDNEDMQAKVIGAMKCSLQDCLSEVSLDWNMQGCVSVVDIPKTPPCIYHGEQIILFALVKSSDSKKAHSGELTLNGVLNGKKVSYKVGINSKGFSSTNLPLHRVAAKYLIKDLECDDEGQYRVEGRKNKDAIVLISQAANIISKYTAFVGVDDETKTTVSLIVESYDYMPRGIVLSSLSTRSMCLGINAYCEGCPPPPPPQMMYANYDAVRGCPPPPPPPPQRMYACHDAVRGYVPPPAPPAPPSMKISARMVPARRLCMADDSDDDDDDDMEEDDNEGWNNFDTEKERSVSEKDGMMGVISLQHFDGSWSPSEELQKILNLTEEKLTMKYKGNVWCTAVVVVYLEKNFPAKKTIWEMIVNKSMKWIATNDTEDKSVEDILKEVREAQVV